jgi:hypothetical protein
VLVVLLAGCGDEEEAAKCEMPAPLLGEFDPRAPEYLVAYRDDVDVEVETERLAAEYGFEPKTVGYAWFTVDVSIGEETREALRCEPSVEYIEYNGIVKPTVARAARGL